MTNLLVGGPLDGKRLESPNKPKLDFWAKDGSGKMKAVAYSRRTMRLEGEVFTFYAPEGESIASAIGHLLQGYRAPKVVA